MYRMLLRYGFLFSLLTGFSLTSACAVGGVDLVRNRTVTVETHAPDKVEISRVGVYRNGEKLIVKGRVSRKHNIHYSLLGHIAIILEAPNGAVLKKAGVLYYPRQLPMRRADSSLFKAEIPYEEQFPGTTVRVEYRSSPDIPEEERL